MIPTYIYIHESESESKFSRVEVLTIANLDFIPSTHPTMFLKVRKQRERKEKKSWIRENLQLLFANFNTGLLLSLLAWLLYKLGMACRV